MGYILPRDPESLLIDKQITIRPIETLIKPNTITIGSQRKIEIYRGEMDKSRYVYANKYIK